MAKSNFLKGLFRREKKDLGRATITITQSDHGGTSPSVGPTTGGANVRSLPFIGSLSAKAQYWLTGGGVIVSVALAGGLTAWTDSKQDYYATHLSSITELKRDLVDLESNSYNVSLGIDVVAPAAYIQQKRVEDTLVYMRSTIFDEKPELKGSARKDIDAAWEEWVGLTGPREKLTELHIALLTVRGKFSGSRAGVLEAFNTFKAVMEAKPEAVEPEMIDLARELAPILNRILGRLENGEANVSYGRSAEDVDGFLTEMSTARKKIKIELIKDPDLRKKAEESLKFIDGFVKTTRELNGLLVNMTEFRSQASLLAKGAGRVLLLTDYASLTIQDLRRELSALNWVVVGLGVFGFLCMAGLGVVSNNENKKRTYEAKNENEANQRAIMSLLDEIASLADGDLTVRATVTEEITGAIADSVNFAISELGTLVTSIKTASGQISDAAGKALNNSNQLLAISNRQAREITETGRSVLGITESIEQVSRRMEDSKRVAKSSVESSERGMEAVTTSIGGIKSIKDNVEETAKRIKRLTEQSSQISEIVELIADISERTSVLAINATVQATKAGAAGKGFKVVADSVQELANQASDATRRIGALINAIQTDIQGAGAAMEKTTDEAVRGAELAEVTGEVFEEIKTTSKALSDIVVEVNEQIGNSARSAAEVSQTMKRVLESVAESSEATKATGEAIEAINKLSEQLGESVSGFQI